MGICSCMSTKWLAIHCLQIALEFKSVDFCEGNKTGEPGAEKNPRSKDNNQQQTQQIQPKYDAGSGNRTQATLAGGERYLAWVNNFAWAKCGSQVFDRKKK